MTARQIDSPPHDLCQFAAVHIRIHGRDDFTTDRHPRDSRPDEFRLLRVWFAANAGVSRIIVRKKNGMRKRNTFFFFILLDSVSVLLDQAWSPANS